MFSLVGDHNATICKHNFSFNQVINAQPVKTTEEAKTSQKHDSRANRMCRTSKNRLLSVISDEKGTHNGI